MTLSQLGRITLNRQVFPDMVIRDNTNEFVNENGDYEFTVQVIVGTAEEEGVDAGMSSLLTSVMEHHQQEGLAGSVLVTVEKRLLENIQRAGTKIPGQ